MGCGNSKSRICESTFTDFAACNPGLTVQHQQNHQENLQVQVRKL
jgi:hypothetical protein